MYLLGLQLILAALPSPTDPPKQGLVDMLLEYLEVRYPGEDVDGDVLYIQVSNQRMFHVRGRRLMTEYHIATATNGLGSETNSFRTPTGLHRVSEKYGDGVPMYGIFKDRRFTGELADPSQDGTPGSQGMDKDWITSRILWLDGVEPGHNKGGGKDSHERYIYIHGTANERSIGTPSSRGCIRMRNADVIALYDQVPIGALVVVLDN